MSRYVIFSHGKESGPWGAKISALAEIARAEGWQVESVDYRGIDDPQERVTRLLSYCREFQGRMVLVGSSMGGHVCTAGSRLLRATGLFLMAPAFYMPGYEDQTPVPPKCPISIVHGWRDDVVPIDNSIRFARQYHASLHVLDSDHRLQDKVGEIGNLFEYFLITLDKFGG